MEETILNTEEKMMLTIESLENKFTNVRAGRANPNMLDGVMVEYYGTPTPINQVANITVPEARQLFIKPFDRSIIKDIERAINEANIGITPTNTGEMVILTVPQLTEETRRNYVKQVDEMGEQAKIALRKNGNYFTSLLIKAYEEDIITDIDMALELKVSLEVMSKIISIMEKEDLYAFS